MLRELGSTNSQLKAAHLLFGYTTFGIQGITAISSCITSMQRLFILVFCEKGNNEPSMNEAI
jgi:hypothetical protein